MMQNIVLVMVLLVNVSLYSAYMVINQSGNYELGNEIEYAPSIIGEAIIQISVGNVVLDLGNNFVTQNGGLSGSVGILIDAGLSNIMIKNGTILNVQGNGVVVNNNCANVSFENVKVINSESDAFSVVGAISPNTCRIIDITNCYSINCGQTAAAMGFSLVHCTESLLHNCFVINCGNSASDFVGVALQNCSSIVCEGCEISGCLGANLTGIFLNQSFANTLKNIRIMGNVISGASDFVAIDLLGAAAPDQANYNAIDSCTIINNSDTSSGVASSLYGLRIGINVQNTLVKKCIVNGNTAVGNGNNVGYAVTGNATTLYNAFIECTVQGLYSANSNSYGFYITGGSNSGIIQHCIIANNEGAGGLGIGIYPTATGGSFWTVRDNHIARNMGSSNTNSYGILEVAGTNNLYTKNIAFMNGVSTGAFSGRQLNSIPTGSRTIPAAPASSNIAAVTGAWTNIAAAS